VVVAVVAGINKQSLSPELVAAEVLAAQEHECCF
jgi:hypothetical protein